MYTGDSVNINSVFLILIPAFNFQYHQNENSVLVKLKLKAEFLNKKTWSLGINYMIVGSETYS